MAGPIYCEFCGTLISNDIRDPRGMVDWVHRQKDVVRCDAHRKTSKLSNSCRTHDPMTGQQK